MFGLLDALGRSTLTECVSNGAVMMKITSSTSITSTSGTTLISESGGGRFPLSIVPNAITISFHRVQPRVPRQAQPRATDVRPQQSYWFWLQLRSVRRGHGQR